MLNEALTMYRLKFQGKYEDVIENHIAFIVVFFVIALVLIAGFFSYAAFCTARGGSFSGQLKLHWPNFWNVGIGCKIRR